MGMPHQERFSLSSDASVWYPPKIKACTALADASCSLVYLQVQRFIYNFKHPFLPRAFCIASSFFDSWSTFLAGLKLDLVVSQKWAVAIISKH